VSTTTLSLQEQTLGIAKVSRILDELEQRRAYLDAELDACSSERRKYHLLGTILDALRELDVAGAADLFWNREITSYSPDKQLQKVHEHVAAFEDKVADIEVRRDQVQSEIDVETGNLRRLNGELVALEEEAEALRHEFRVFRDPSEIPYRPLVMPWSRNGEDDRRYRKFFLASLFVSLSLGSVVLLFKPGHEKRQEEFIPERVAELVVKKKEEPKKPERKTQDNKPLDRTTAPKSATPQPTRQTSVADKDTPSRSPGPLTDNPAGTPDAQQVARASAQTKGVLAHQNEFAGLIDSSGPVKVGAEGVVSNTGQIAAGTATTRSLIVSQVGGSGGINVAAISRNGNGGGGTGGAGTGTGGGGGGNGFGGSGLGGGGSSITGGGGGVKVAKVQSSTGAAAADARPLSNGAAPSRTDEEIQIVFDRYKAALYRIYNRELRNDPSLKGKMVLRLTIEPDGHVSACAVKSTDLASPALSAEVVERVLKFNFGAKQGVPPITITYPIDFLPAA
jgi:outer membrane biosynthesis protein TonB